MPRQGIVALAIVALAFVLATIRGSPPAPLGADAPRDAFSAARARELQTELAGLGPRPAGSDGNAKARALVVAALARSGWSTEEDTAFVCGRWGACAYVHDVIATRAGRDQAAAPVMMAAHYDSVPSSPGASDDGAGTAAVLEAARAIAEGVQLRRTVVVVLADGEEDGLLGAEAFARRSPLAKRIKAVVNVDSRGGSGPSAMFETSPGNDRLIALYARNTTHPTSSSLFYEVYKRMPNDTDLTVYKRFAHGLNFANTRGIEHYHTPNDAIANADPGTLQHHGDNVLAMTRALGEADIEGLDRDAAWFDVLSLFVVRWPASWSRGIGLAVLAFVVGQAIRMRSFVSRRSRIALAAAPAALAAAALATVGLGYLLHAIGATTVPWLARPLPAILALHCTSIAAGGAAASFVARRADAKSLWTATWGLWAAAGVAAPAGASFLFFVPALVAGLAAFAPSRDADAPSPLASLLPIAAASILLLPLAVPIYDAMGLAVPPLLAAPSTLLVTTFVPLLGAATVPRRWPLAPAVVALAGCIASAIVAPFSAARPQRVNVVFEEDATRARAGVQASWGWTQWGAPPPAMIAALGATPRLEPIQGWMPPGPVVDVPRIDLPLPSVVIENEVAEGATRRARLHVRSSRGARTISFELAQGRRATLVVEREKTTPRNGTLVAVRGVPRAGLDAELWYDGAAPFDLVVHDISEGVPEGSVAARVVAARPPDAAQSQDGDVTVLTVHTLLGE